MEISKTRTTPLNPRSDGFIERVNRTIQNILSKMVQNDQKDWDRHLDFIVMAYNSTIQDSSGFSHHRLVYGEEMSLPLDVLTQSVVGDNSEQYNTTEYVSNLQDKIKQIYSLVRENLHSARKNKTILEQKHATIKLVI